MTEKLSNTVASTLDDDLYEFVKAAASKDGTDVAGYIRAAMNQLRNEKRNEYKLWHSVFERHI
tara:strand:- start:1145 stop:1333 length:189 start_codon:yes stop_codon:yes gene_type:complete